MKENPKLFVIGLDGCTWDVLLPLINRGYLPFLSSLRDNGISTEFNSTFPPITAPAWTAMATGLNPGKTGAFDFVNRRDFSYSLHPVNSKYYQKKSIWDIASDNGYKVGIFYYPMLYPAYEINGSMISGIGGFEDKAAFYPHRLHKELKERFEDIGVRVRYHDEKYEDIDIFWSDVEQAQKNLFNNFNFLVKQDFELTILIISITDFVQHRAWQQLEEILELGDRKEHSSILDFWTKLDKDLERILGDFLGESNIIFVSDHGFGKQDAVFNLSRWLIENNYARESRASESTLASNARNTYRRIMPNNILRRRINQAIKERRTIGKMQTAFSSQGTGLDVANSPAYTLEHTIPFGAVYLNVRGRERDGVIDQMEYKSFRRNLKEDLAGYFRDIDIELNVYYPEDIYSGPYTKFAPDILFQIGHGRGVVISNKDKKVISEGPFSNRHFGSHRMNGIFLAHGPSFTRKDIGLQSMDIYCLMPLCLALLGLDFNEGLDGILHEELLSDEERKKREAIIMTLKEKERIRRKLRMLE